MRKFVLVFLLLLAIPAMASHIVGGEFELLHISGNNYRLNVILYFDLVNGQPSARDTRITASVYRKRDNMFMGNVILPLITETHVNYTQPACSINSLSTSKITYSSTLVLSPDIYTDPQGYYVAWERCCRNYSITNIYSEDVARNAARFAGQTFYLEFPAVVKNGQPFINSSPQLFPPLSDYACPFRPYYVDFAGIDVDGDSLAYSLITPLSTHTTGNATQPKPYPEVTWRPGFSLDHIMNGSPDLKISRNGLLTVMPRSQGLFVFAVRIDQYRDGEKIGESRRDFQMLVTDGCTPDSPPQILGKKTSELTFTHDNAMSVSFSNTVADADRCIQVRVSDPESSLAAENFTENISLRVVGLDFKNKNLNQILPATSTATLTNGSTKDFSICFPQCPYVNGPYTVGIIAFDDACSLPMTDTLKVTVNVQPPPNTAPYFTTPTSTTAILNEGDQFEWPFEIRDDELDPIVVSLVTNGFILANAGMKFTILTQQNGLVTGKLSWDAYCNVYDFTKRTSFEVKLLAEDADRCELSNSTSALYRLSVRLPGNADPIIYTDLTSNKAQRQVINLQRKINESLSFNVFGSDITDNDYLVLDLLNKTSYSNLSLSFPKATGNTTVQSPFLWNIKCDGLDLAKQDMYTFSFVVVDNANKCKLYKADTVDVQVKVLPPDNAKPSLNITSLNPDLVMTNKQLNVTLGQQITLGIQGYDADVLPQKDALSLDLIVAKGNVKPENYSFTALKGQSPVSTTFVWNPGCNIFQDGVYENDYTFTFRLADNNCYKVKADTLSIKIKIKDVDGSNAEFLPVNFFSPNDDGVNDYYSMEVINKET
ncbi:MAG TPA: hypothetical protein VFE57_07195, partial [Cyclobacteriaceae bacterium]|nr:hypothetical protein [Cyclobacteriaceae bacterium]